VVHSLPRIASFRRTSVPNLQARFPLNGDPKNGKHSRKVGFDQRTFLPAGFSKGHGGKKEKKKKKKKGEEMKARNLRVE
jgi:hypothetical protein